MLSKANKELEKKLNFDFPANLSFPTYSIVVYLSINSNIFILINTKLSSFLKKSDVAKITLKLLDKKGIMNVGGVKQSAYNFAKKLNSKVKKNKLKKKDEKLLGKDTSLNIKKLKKTMHGKKN